MGHYMYMREYWVQVHSSPIVYRYVDWSITVPLQMIEFNLILKAAGKETSALMFWKLLIGTVVMLSFGYLGEIQAIKPMVGFIGGLCGWFFILAEIFVGEAGGMAGQCSQAVATSFKNMRLIVTLGWSIYPAGYYFGYLLGAVSDDALNVTYNIADFINKIAFVLGLRQGRLCRKGRCPVGLKSVKTLLEIADRSLLFYILTRSTVQFVREPLSYFHAGALCKFRLQL